MACSSGGKWTCGYVEFEISSVGAAAIVSSVLKFFPEKKNELISAKIRKRKLQEDIANAQAKKSKMENNAQQGKTSLWISILYMKSMQYITWLTHVAMARCL